MLKTLNEILDMAENGRYAVIAPDFPSLFICRILLEAAEESHTPIILSYSTSFKPLLDVGTYARFVRILRDEIEQYQVPAALHLDHATDLADISEAVDVGFTSVMIDASFEPFSENLKLTQKAVKIAHSAGVSVEAEIGHVSSSADYINKDSFAGFLTIPEEAVTFVNETNIDALAVAIGTVHGPIRGQPCLDYDRLKQLDELIRIPLVLHGSSGLSEENLRRCVELGIRKINVYSDLMMSFLEESYAELSLQRTNPVSLGVAQANAVRRVIETYFRYSGSMGSTQED